MEECSRKVQKVSTHESSFIVMYLAVVEIHRSAAALNVKASALPNKESVRVTSSNRVMDEGSGKIQEAGAHVVSFIIVMDIAIVESHVAAADVKTPALQSKEGKGHGKVIQRGDG